MTEPLLAIGELASRAHTTVSAIRYYESVGLLQPPHRVGGKRRYEPAVLAQLALIQTAKAAGFKIAEIRQLIESAGDRSPGPAWRRLVLRKREEIERTRWQLDAMTQVLDRVEGCGCSSLERCGEAALEGRSSATLPT